MKPNNYLHDVIDWFLLKKNIDLPKHHFDKKKQPVVRWIFHLYPMYRNRDSKPDCEPSEKIPVFFLNSDYFTYRSIAENIFIQNEFFRKDIIKIPFKRMTIETFTKCFSLFNIAIIFSLDTRFFHSKKRIVHFDELVDHVDACNRIVCNHPSKLQQDASNFFREHRLCLEKSIENGCFFSS